MAKHAINLATFANEDKEITESILVDLPANAKLKLAINVKPVKLTYVIIVLIFKSGATQSVPSTYTGVDSEQDEVVAPSEVVTLPKPIEPAAPVVAIQQVAKQEQVAVKKVDEPAIVNMTALQERVAVLERENERLNEHAAMLDKENEKLHQMSKNNVAVTEQLKENVCIIRDDNLICSFPNRLMTCAARRVH